MDTIEGGSTLFAVFRHIEIGLSHAYAYRPSTELRENYSDWCRDYYDDVRLPGGYGTGPFFNKGFERSVVECIDVWRKAYA
ncbi:MAG: hypothetical protein HY962_16835 [Ignavibacteriae bacterium]|nr:hypothetical protein [Ignavibacteriota bacterium]